MRLNAVHPDLYRVWKERAGLPREVWPFCNMLTIPYKGNLKYLFALL